MAQYIKQGDIFGRVGSAIGKGLADQLPEEINRGRLAAGLNNVSQQKDQTPFQQFAALASTPGITPQMIQSGTELLKQQGLRQSFNKQRGQSVQQPASPRLPEYMPSQNVPGRIDRPSNTGVVQNASPSENVRPNEIGQPQILDTNPLRQETKTVRPMTPDEKIDDIARLGEDFPGLTYPELKQMSDENEQRRQAQPEAARSEDERLRGISDRLKADFRSLLEKKLQKTGDKTYADITGAMENNLVRAMNKDLKSNPRLSEADVVNKWTEKALDLSKAKNKLEGKLGSSLFATPILLNRNEFRNGLKDLSDIYRKAGNSDEFYETLKVYGFSPRGAASLAYPTNSSLQKYMSSAPKGKSNNTEFNSKNSRQIATEVEKLITPQDSILALAQNLLQNDQYFDLQSFLDQIREDKDEIGLTPRQNRELSEAGHLLPTWADFLVLPWRGQK